MVASSEFPPLIRAEQVSKNYRMGEVDLLAVNRVSLSIARGDFIAIAGASGSGKTTLLNLLAAIDTPSEGEVYIDDVRVSSLSRDALSAFRAERIGFVFQTFNLLPVLTAAENVEYPLLLLKVPPRERRERVREALVRVGLERFAKHRPAQLSGGQRQRVAVARAMVKNPRVVLADEPTANLDKHTAVEVVELMHELNREEGISFVFSSHDPMILSRASRVVHLSDGEIVPEGSKDAI